MKSHDFVCRFTLKKNLELSFYSSCLNSLQYRLLFPIKGGTKAK